MKLKLNVLAEKFSQFYTVFFFGLICFVVGAAYFTIKYSPIPADPMGITLVEVAQAEGVEQSIPILDKIAECESGNMHFDPKTGQVLTVGNTNKTVDIGRYGEVDTRQSRHGALGTLEGVLELRYTRYVPPIALSTGRPARAAFVLSL